MSETQGTIRYTSLAGRTVLAVADGTGSHASRATASGLRMSEFVPWVEKTEPLERIEQLLLDAVNGAHGSIVKNRCTESAVERPVVDATCFGGSDTTSAVLATE